MTASILPPAVTSFSDSNGRPLAGGKIYFYVPNSSVFKQTWQDAGQTVANPQPVVLDANGQAIIYGDGQYRQVVNDVHGNLIWDRLTDSPALNSELQGFISSLSSSSGVAMVGGAAWYAANAIGFDATKTPDGATVICSGRSTQNDGGGGVFTYYKNGTQPVDNGLVFSPAAGGRLVRQGWTATGFNGMISVRWFGAKADGATDDTTAIQASISAGGWVEFVSNATHKITSPLSLDISLARLSGQGSVIDASGSPTGALQVFSSATYGAQRLERNWTHWIEGIAFEGNGLSAQDLVTVGHATYTECSEITFRNCSFRRGGKLVKFIDNAWRVNFDHCGFETPISNYLHFDAPANAGEVMRFAHCWFVDGANAYIYLREGQWFFDRCSFPGGGIGGVQCVGAPHVRLSGCNIETQPAAANQYVVEGYGSSVVILDGCIISTNGGQANQALLNAGDACAMRIQNCTLPLYGADLRSETNSGIRQLVTGSSSYVTAHNNYVKGTGANDRTQWAVLGKQVNLLRNGDAESPTTTVPWVASTYGTDLTSTFTNVTTSPKTGSRCFLVDCKANGGIEVTQTITGANSYAGRQVVYGMWAKASGGTGNVDFPGVRFLDASGATISTLSIATASTDTAWTWIGGFGVAPTGTVTIVMVIGGQQQAGAHQIYYDDIVLNVI